MAQMIAGNGPEDMRALAVKLRAADPALKRELRREFRLIAQPVVERVQRSILTAGPSFRSRSAHPTKRHHKPGKIDARPHALRAEIARTVSSSVGFTKAGVRLDIVSSGRKMPTGKENLNADTDVAKGWGHPVFARPGQSRRDRTWVREWGKPRWFEDPATRAGLDAKQAAQNALETVRRKLS